MKEEKKKSTSKQVKKSKPVTKEKSPKKTVKSTSKKTTVLKSKNTSKKPQNIKPIVIEKKEEPITEVVPKKVPTINYMTVTVVLLSVVLVVIILAKIYGTSQNIDYSESYLVKNNVVHKISCDDIPNAITGKQSFIYIPKLANEEEYQLEKKLSSIIKEYHLEEDFYLYEIDEKTCGSLTDNESLGSKNLKLENSLEKIPTILYYRDGILMEIVQREDDAMLNDGDFVKLLDIYEIK